MDDESVKKVAAAKNAVPRPRVLVAIVIGSLYLVEVVIMNFFHEFAETAYGTMDALILTTVLLPLLYFSIYRPFSRSVKDLKALSGTLERRVRERTVQLEFSEAVHRAVIASSADAIVRINSDGAILSANPAAYYMFGYGKSELENKHISLLLPDGYERVLVEGFAASLDGWDGHSAASVAEAVAVTKSGKKLTVECTSSECLVNSEISFVIDMRDVSERRKAEKELVSIMEAQPDILYVINMKGALIKWNSTLQKLCGLTRDQMMGRPAADFVCEEDRWIVYEGIKEVFEKGSASIEVRFIRHDGALVPHLCNGAVWRNPDGEPLGFIGVGKDISEHKKAEEALRGSERKFKRFFSMLPVALGVVNKDGVITEFNPRFTEVFGYTIDDIPTIKEWWERAYPDESYRRRVLETWGNAVDKAAKEGTDIEPIEYKVTCKSGVERFVMVGGSILSDGGVLATFVDVTEKKKAEQALRESEGRYRQLSEASFEGVVITVEGRMVDCNTSFARKFGYARDEIIGKTPLDLVPPESYAIVADHIGRGSEERYEAVGLKKDGTLFPVEIQGRGTLYHGQKARVTSIRDITERVKAEQAIRESEDLLRVTFDNAATGMAFVSLDGKFLRVNAARCRIHGYEEQELIGRSFQEITHPDDLHAGEAFLRKVARGEAATQEVEKRFIRKDGGVIWCSVFTSLIKDAHGKPLHIFTQVIDITARKEAEKTYAELFNVISDGLVLHEFDPITKKMGNFVDVNDAMCKRLGYSREEMLKMGPNDIDTGETVTKPEEYGWLERENLEHGSARFERVHRAKDGRLISVEIISRQFPLGGKTMALSVVRDITERKAAEEKVRAAELRFRTFFEQSPFGAAIIDIETALPVEFNDTACRQLGYTREDFARLRIGDYEAKETPEETVMHIAKILKEGEDTFETKHRTKGGGIRDMLISIKLIALDGKPMFFCIFQDITARKAAEEKLKASEQALLKAQGLAHLGGWELDVQTGKVTWSDETYRIFGFEPGAVESTHDLFMGLVHPDDRNAVQGNLGEIFSGKRARLEGEARIIRPDGKERVLSTKLEAVAGKDGKLSKVIGANLDITERKAAEDKLKAAKEVAEEATLLKDKFVSLVSHDLKTPLSSMIGFLKLVRYDYAEPLNEGAKLILDRAAESGEAMVRLIDDLLTISRFKTGQLKLNKQFFDAEYLGAMMAGNYAHLARQKGIEIESTIPAYSRIYGDKTLLTEAIQNLVTNAIKFCKSGDHITISLAEGDAPAICVRDTGPGIQPNLLADLFKFEKKTSTRGTAGETGTGFGLPLVKDIIELHGGELGMNCEPGKGCLFSLTLPYVRPKILLVDDDRNSRLLQILRLRELNADIIEAENGQDALNVMATVRPHLIITDIQMPVMDGLELLKRIKGAPDTKDIPVIVVSGEYGMEIRDTVFKFGGDDFVTKKIDKIDFFPRVRRFIG